MAKKYRRRRRRGSRKASVSQVHKIVKKEVGKTRETNRLVGYVGWSRINDLLTTTYPAGVNLPEPDQAICCYSLTGGIASTVDSTQDPSDYVVKNLFCLLPTSENPSPNVTGVGILSGVGQAQQGGMENQMDGSGNADAATVSEVIANVHQLEGRSCYLKKFYASVCLNNAESSSVETPTNTLIRAMVIQTRRPLSSTELGKQILLQNHSTIKMSPGSSDATNYPCSALGYLNRDVIKKVMYDKVFTLNGGGGASGSLRRFKLKVNINQKARWSYYYPSGVPRNNNEGLTYQGPFLYLVMWAAQAGAFDNAYPAPAAGNYGGGISKARRPAFALSSILTFMDD